MGFMRTIFGIIVDRETVSHQNDYFLNAFFRIFHPSYLATFNFTGGTFRELSDCAIVSRKPEGSFGAELVPTFFWKMSNMVIIFSRFARIKHFAESSGSIGQEPVLHQYLSRLPV